MPYSIKVTRMGGLYQKGDTHMLSGPAWGGRTPAEIVHNRLAEAVKRDGRFTVAMNIVDTNLVELKRVRLAAPKEYCGNHPGECIVSPFGGARKKMKARYLEWDDWVAFHSIVNDLLDELNIEADVWSKPQDARGKFWMRKGQQRRVRYDYEEQMVPGRMFPVRVWNCGTPDQFEVR